MFGRRVCFAAPPEFVQWPQSVSNTPGGTATFTCVAQGVPEPNLLWLKNGKPLPPGENNRLSNSNSTLTILRVTTSDEALYQCIAENTAGTNQASARLAVTLPQEAPSPPEGVTALPLSTSSIQVTWKVPPLEVTDGIIGYVLHICKAGERSSRELQEALNKNTFKHVLSNLEPSTTYSIFLRAYSPVGASRDSNTVLATTLGSVPRPPDFSIKVLNSSAVQVSWALSPEPGQVHGYRLQHRKIPSGSFHGTQILPGNTTSFTYTNLEAASLYEIKLLAFNGNGAGNGTLRFVSLRQSEESPHDADSMCHCQEGESSMLGVVVGIHIGVACIIFCLLFLLFGYRKSLFCKKGTQDNWTVPQVLENTQRQGQDIHSEPRHEGKDEDHRKPAEMVELITQNSSQTLEMDPGHVEVSVEHNICHQSST
ncbi:immunoglobulin superfamily DCC subclass member 3-like [Ascaphus truei]|uniref:immunoglobulin superfamily DCC subclass member 3-like n=1 Tax=Ascaphus truei TaxID=8439 RepID=UPI003F5A4AE2